MSWPRSSEFGGAGGNATVPNDALVLPPSRTVGVLTTLAVDDYDAPLDFSSLGLTRFKPSLLTPRWANRLERGQHSISLNLASNAFTNSDDIRDIIDAIYNYQQGNGLFMLGNGTSVAPTGWPGVELLAALAYSANEQNATIQFNWRTGLVQVTSDNLTIVDNSLSIADVVALLQALVDWNRSDLTQIDIHGGTSAAIPRRNEGGWTFTNGVGGGNVWSDSSATFHVFEDVTIPLVGTHGTGLIWYIGTSDAPTANQKTGTLEAYINGTSFDDSDDLRLVNVGANIWQVTGKNANQKVLEGVGINLITN